MPLRRKVRATRVMLAALLEASDPKWIEKTVNDFNALSASLKIDGRNRTGSAIKLDRIPQPQKVKAKP